MRNDPLQSLQEVDDEVARLVSSGIHIPPQPRIVIDATRLLLSRQCDLREVAQLISHDAGLTAMLYKITRSAAFSRARPPQSVEQILALVGLRQTAVLVQAYGVTAALKSAEKRSLEQFWNRTTNIAQLASLICYERSHGGVLMRITPEQAYMIGIFHDCGVPVLMQRFPQYCKETGASGANSWIDVHKEDQAFQVDHCSIGYLLARHWRLPELVADAILWHHELAQIVPPPVRSLVAVLNLAMHLHAGEQGLSEPDWGFMGHIVLDELGIHPDDMNEVADRVVDMFRAESGR